MPGVRLRSIAVMLAVTTALVSVYTSATAARTVASHHGAVWLLVPVLACALLLAGVIRQHMQVAWYAVGMLWGTVVLGIWSIGSWYIASATMATLAAASVARGRSHAVGLLWTVLGATSLCLINVVRAAWYGLLSENSGFVERISVSPIEQAGALAFGLLTIGFTARTVLKDAWRNVHGGQRGQR